MLHLHIGTPKSGTTSIQQFMRSNRKALVKQGIFPRLGMLEKMSMMEFIQKIRRPGGDAVARQFASEVAMNCKKHENVVISNEMLSFGFVPDVLLPPLLEEVKEPIKVLCYIRRPDLYLESVYKQRTKNGFAAPDPQLFLHQYKKNALYNLVLDQYASYVGKENITVRIFDRAALPKGNVIYDFAERIGIQNIDQLDNVETETNRSLSRALSEATGKLAKATEVRGNMIVQDILSRKNPKAFRSHDTYTLAQRRNILKYTEASLEAVRTTYRPDLDVLFDDKDLAEGAEDRYPSPEEQVELTAAALDEIVLSASKIIEGKANASMVPKPEPKKNQSKNQSKGAGATHAMSPSLDEPLKQAAESALQAAKRVS